MNASRKISGDDLLILESLFDKALAESGITDKKFVNLLGKETRQLRDSVIDYSLQNTDPEDSNYARYADDRIYNNYRRKLKIQLYASDYDKVVTEEDRIPINRKSRIGYQESMINSVVLYATKGRIKTWPLFRSQSNSHGDKHLETEDNLKNGKKSKPRKRVSRRNVFIVLFITLPTTASVYLALINDLPKLPKKVEEVIKSKFHPQDLIKIKVKDELGQPIPSADVHFNSKIFKANSEGYLEIKVPDASQDSTYLVIFKAKNHESYSYKYYTSQFENTVILKRLKSEN